MELKRKGTDKKESILKKQFDIKTFTLFCIFCIYPLLVVPNGIGYFYFPRYIMLGFIAILCFIEIIKEKEIKTSNIYIPLILYLICIVIASITAINSQTAFVGLFGIQKVPIAGQENGFAYADTSRFTGLTTIVFCIILYLTAYKTGKSDKLISSMVIVAGIVGIVAIMQHFGVNIVPHEDFRDGFPPYGTIGQHNFLATYMVFILPAAIYKFVKSNGYLWLINACLIFAGLLVSTTRGAWMACGISMAIMALYYLRKKDLRRGFVITVIALTIVGCVLMPTNNGVLFKRLLSIPSNVSSGLQLEDGAGSGRLSIWKQVVKLIPNNWAFGVGPDNLIYTGTWLGPNAPVDKAHNIYLETAVTIGIPALIFYLVFLSFFIFRRWKTDKGFMFFVMILTYMIQGFFNIDVIMVLPLFWIVLGFSQANYEEEQKLIETSNPWNGRNI